MALDDFRSQPVRAILALRAEVGPAHRFDRESVFVVGFAVALAHAGTRILPSSPPVNLPVLAVPPLAGDPLTSRLRAAPVARVNLLATLAAVASPQDPPQDPPTPLPPVVVEGRADSLVGTADRASQGVVGQEDLRRRALLRPAEVIEAVPGIVVTQHSGSGKSNQLFARGFNLDHGTDLATSLFGVPLNMPSHGHGQGYTDLNPLIPELVDTVKWRLGPYDVRDGDFGSAGAVDIDYVRRLEAGLARVEIGSYGYARTLIADSHRVGRGDLLAAVELQQVDGRFTVDQDYQKKNGYLSWATDDFRIAGFAHTAEWTATDQLPLRAVRDGRFNRWDSADPTTGGTTDWSGAVAEWTPRVDRGTARAVGYVFHYDLDLYSNFTYAAADPVRGDQIEQRDNRTTFGYDVARTWHWDSGVEFTLGSELRSDFIQNGLHSSAARQRFATVRTDEIRQHSLAVYGEGKASANDWLRGYVGVRGDFYWFDVDSDLDANSGRDDDGIANGKAGLALGPWAGTEVYLNAGTGFHSNDARGVLTRDDPTTSTPGDGTPVDPLVRSRGAEVGVRTTVVPGLQTTASPTNSSSLSSSSPHSDAGATEPNRASRRYGVELANHWRPLPWLTLDADLTTSRVRFRGDDPAGDYIPGSVPLTFVGGIGVDWMEGLSSGVRMRYLGNRPLIEDGSIRSTSTTLVSLRTTWQFHPKRAFTLDVLNLFDREDSDIEYFYGSQLPGEAGPSDDVHFHPVEPFSIRIGFTATF
jgi:hypothetical protein